MAGHYRWLYLGVSVYKTRKRAEATATELS
jgi:hypothetical protein